MHGDEIARYLDDAMSGAERGRFEARLSSDAAMRRLVDAERAIRATLAAQLASLPAEHAATRAHMLSALSSLPATTGPASAPAAPRDGSSLLRWAGTSGAGIAIVVGGYLVTSHGLSSGDDRSAPSRAQSTEQTTSSRTAPPRMGPPQTTPQTTPPATMTPQAGGSQTATPPPGSRASGAPIVSPPSTARGAAEGRSAQARDVVGGSPETASRPTDTQAPRKRELRVIDRDSVRLNVGVDELRRRP
jgi:hypothetical protein